MALTLEQAGELLARIKREFDADGLKSVKGYAGTAVPRSLDRGGGFSIVLQTDWTGLSEVDTRWFEGAIQDLVGRGLQAGDVEISRLGSAVALAQRNL